MKSALTILLLLFMIEPGLARGGGEEYWDDRMGEEVFIWPQCEDPKNPIKRKNRTKIFLISPYEVARKMKRDDVELIDVRTDYEFEKIHLAGAVNIRYDHVLQTPFRDSDLKVLYCGECCCPEVYAAAAAFVRRGYRDDIAVLRGGLKEVGPLVLWLRGDTQTPKQLVNLACGPARDEVQELTQKIDLDIVPPIKFQFNKAILRGYSKKTLKMIADIMKRYRDIKLKVYGHTCEIGTPEYNLRLSDRRADAVAAYLIRRGIHSRRLRTEGFGDTKSIADNETEEGRKKNRRVEFEWLEADAPD